MSSFSTILSVSPDLITPIKHMVGSFSIFLESLALVTTEEKLLHFSVLSIYYLCINYVYSLLIPNILMDLFWTLNGILSIMPSH